MSHPIHTPIHTIGHSNRSAAEFLDLLREFHVELLVDVRRYPGSRRHPYFARVPLEVLLRERGLDYRHLPSLGGHREPTGDATNAGLRGGAFRGYADHMQGQEFRAGVERLLGWGAQRRLAVMCAEARPEHCHRRLLSDALAQRGAEVRHVLEAGLVEPHELDPAARATADGWVSYPRSGQLELF